MLAYSQMTNTRMLALLGDPHGDAYELLFSFSSPESKAEFLHLLQSNRKTAFEDEEILVPTRREIEAAQPIALVLPEDVMRQVTIIATNLFCGQNEIIQELYLSYDSRSGIIRSDISAACSSDCQEVLICSPNALSSPGHCFGPGSPPSGLRVLASA